MHLDAPAVMHVVPLGEAMAVYPVIGEPFAAGAAHVTVMDWLPALTDGLAGAAGAVANVTLRIRLFPESAM